MNWLALSIIATLFWGLWSIMIKMALQYLDWHQVYLFSSIPGVIIAITMYFTFKSSKIDINSPALYYSIIAGVLGAIGTIAFNMALKSGKASIIVPLTSLYPVIAIITARILLRERITLIQGIGVLFAIISMLLLSITVE
ncbi:MAG: EamA family transporter [archaeon GB-1867-005]|nr:EamA family transporter [Candidatus Culexmicrobium cathedralense]